jgi:hypothetical protein
MFPVAMTARADFVTDASGRRNAPPQEFHPSLCPFDTARFHGARRTEHGV